MLDGAAAMMLGKAAAMMPTAAATSCWCALRCQSSMNAGSSMKLAPAGGITCLPHYHQLSICMRHWLLAAEAVDLFARTHSQQSDTADDFDEPWLSRRASATLSNASPDKSQATSSKASAAATPTHHPTATAATAAAGGADQSQPASPGALMAQLSELALLDNSAAEQRHTQRQDSEALSSQQHYQEDTATVSTTEEALAQHLESSNAQPSPYSEPPMPKYTIDEQGVVSFEYDHEYVSKKYQVGAWPGQQHCHAWFCAVPYACEGTAHHQSITLLLPQQAITA
jgi:hypothetical protein